MKKFLAPIFALILLAGLAFVWLAPQGLQRAPEFQLTSLDGDKISNHSLSGKPVFITFWATSCVSCVAEIPHLIELHNKFQARGLTVLAIAMDYDPVDQIRAMRQQLNLPYTIAHDADGLVASRFGDIRLTPTNLLLAPDGTIVFQKIGEVDFAQIEKQLEAWL